MALLGWLLDVVGRTQPAQHQTGRPARGRCDHVVILDGTMSSLVPGCETNAGLLYKLLEPRIGPNLTLYYEPGLQWRDWRSAYGVLTGRGINRQIRRAYGALAGRYRRGDRIFLVGYSRGAYAVRSLGGMIDAVGLVQPKWATVRHIRQAYRLYEADGVAEARAAFAKAYAAGPVEIEAIAVWDTVKALGIRLPLVWRLTEHRHLFHNHRLGPHVVNGFHALARDETRVAYTPVIWESAEGWGGNLEQLWFRGTHGDVGGHLLGFEDARPLSNIPFVWIVARLEACGLPLPEGWQSGFPQSIEAPSRGNWRGVSWLFLSRRRRAMLTDPSEQMHESVPDQ